MMKILLLLGICFFVHFYDSKEREAYEPVILIPPAIFERMISYTNIAISSLAGLSLEFTSQVKITVVENKGNYYIAYTSARGSSTYKRIHYTFYLLKNI